jgi:FkbM family methyltransferase
VEMVLDTSNFIDRALYTGCYEPHNAWRFRHVLRPGNTVLDVGANIGFFTALAARCVGPSGRVVAFEPHPVNFQLLQRAVGAMSQVQLHAIGLDECDGEGHVAMADQNVFANRTASMVAAEAAEGAVRVATRSIDSLAAEIGLDHIDLLKVDVDGYETRILKGAREMFAQRRVRHLIVELHPFWLSQSGSGLEEVERLLASAGMKDVSGSEWLPGALLGPSPDRHYCLL